MKKYSLHLLLGALCIAGMVWFQTYAHHKMPAPEKLQAAFPGDTRKILENSQRLTLISLDPNINGRSNGKDSFYGYRILGQTLVSTDDKSTLIAALYNGMANANDYPAACFSPRHGIHAVQGNKAVDLVICFQCAQFVVIPQGKKKSDVKWPSFGHAGSLVSASAQPTFDRVLSNAAIPLSP